MSGQPAKVRALHSRDLEIRELGDLLQVLLGAGDTEFVASIRDSVRARVRWLLERDAPAEPVTERRAG